MRHFDLVIVGSGSGNSIINPDLDDWDIAMVESGAFGGTCLNRGCIPSKMLVYAADIAELARRGPELGVDTRFERADWPSIRDRVFGRIDPISEAGRRYRADECANVTVYECEGRFVDEKKLAVDDELITADRFVLAAGARVRVPDIPGLGDVGYQTSDTIMRIDEIPERLIVLGGGYIASEMGHVFGSLGSQLTIVNRSDSLLRAEDDEIRRRFTEAMQRRFDVRLHTQVLAARREGADVVLDISTNGEHSELRGDEILVAIGRVPNGDHLDVSATGVGLDHEGYVEVDELGRTAVEGIWALGDICNPAQLKHTANAEARAVAHNLAHPDDLVAADLRFIPHAVFGSPQVAAVGPTEREIRDSALPYRCIVRHYADAAYGWAMEDTTSVCKLIGNPETGRLLAAHLVGPQASTLVQQLIQGMALELTVEQMATGHLYIHPALPEVVEQALLELRDAMG